MPCSFIYSPKDNGSRLSGGVNTEEFEGFPCIAPDESYLIFYARGRTEGTGQYISFRQADGAWSEPVNVGQAINGGAIAFSLSFSPDRRFLFVLRRNGGDFVPTAKGFREGIYWADAGILEMLKRPPF